jgi:hypothetical protein
VSGKRINFNIVNFAYSTVLDKNGRFHDTTHSVSLKANGTFSVVVLKVTRSNLRSLLAPTVPVNAQAATLPGQPIAVSIGDPTGATQSDNFGQAIDLKYSAKKGKGIISN